MPMTFIYIIIALFVVVTVGMIVGRRNGWRSGLGAALAALLITGTGFVGLLILVVNSMG